MTHSFLSQSIEHIHKFVGEVAPSDIPQYLLACQLHGLTRSFSIGSLRVDLQNGMMIGAEGLMVNQVVFSMGDLMMNSMQNGEVYETALKKCAEVMIQTALVQGSTTIQSVSEMSARPMELPYKISHLLIDQISQNLDDNEVLLTLTHASKANIIWPVSQEMTGQIGLPLSWLKFYRTNLGTQRLSDIIGDFTRLTPEMKQVYVLSVLGLVVIEGAESSEDSTSTRRRRRRRSTKQFVEVETAVEMGGTTVQDHVAADVAETSEALSRLQSMHQQVSVDKVPAYKLFGLTAPNEVNDAFIDDAFRKLSLQWHPDRFDNDVERDMATDLYTHLNELYNGLKDEDVRVELRKRLDVERRGEQYVSAEDETKSVMLLEQGRFFFQKRRFAEAHEVLSKAVLINPYNWRINTYLIRCEAELGMKPKPEAAEILEGNKDARGSDRVTLLFQAGEYYYQSDMKDKAYEMFTKVVEIDEGHIDAKRYLHLRSRRQQAEQPSEEKGESTGFFSRLFGRK